MNVRGRLNHLAFWNGRRFRHLLYRFRFDNGLRDALISRSYLLTRIINLCLRVRNGALAIQDRAPRAGSDP